MNTAQTRFTEFTDSLDAVNFKRVIESNKYGPRFDAGDYDLNGNVKTIRGTDVSQEGEIKYSQVPTAKLDSGFIQDHILKNGDLVMITTADCGLTGVFRKQDVDYIPSAYAVKIELNKLGYPYYFKYYFQTKRIKEEINKYVRKGTVANLPLSDIGKISIKLPNILEQTKIANFLTAVDEKISFLTQKYHLLSQYKKGVMQKIFSQELRFKDVDGNDFPEWKEKLVSEVFNDFKGTGLSKDKIGEVGKNKCILYGHLFTRYSEVITDIESRTDFEEGLISEAGDILIPSSTTTKGIDLAKASSLNQSGVLLGGDIIVLRLKEKGNSNFFAYLLTHAKSKDIAEITQGITIIHLYFSQLKNILLNCPCEKEQTKIANFLSAIDDKITATQTQLQAVKQYKQGLLQQMFV